ncbi:histidine phosphatase family protein [Muricoccus radiodurans]|uniref:histidine phosphatase family protein n=1 Tax=Muricoccus radiodurans TaxID=2231721 RepID=UPI003CF351FD
MATTLFLVRHAAHDRVHHVLCGRMPGVTLGETGRRQAAALGRRLAGEGISAVYTSPLERARETAAPIAARLGLAPRENPGLAEIDFGEWTGQRFDALAGDPRWDRWNTARATSRAPGGESMAEAQARAVAAVEGIGADHPEERVALVSHADVIKAVLASVMGLSLDAHDRFEVSPASVSAIAIWDGGGKVLSMNEVVAA